MQVLHSHMKKEIDSCRSTLTAYDLVKTRGMRRISICLMAVWSDMLPLVHLTFCLPLHLSSCPASFLSSSSVFLFLVLFVSCFFVFIFLFICLIFPRQLSWGPTSAIVLFCRFATSFAYYGLVMDLQKFGVSHFLSIEANNGCDNIWHVQVPTCHWKLWSHSIMASLPYLWEMNPKCCFQGQVPLDNPSSEPCSAV